MERREYFQNILEIKIKNVSKNMEEIDEYGKNIKENVMNNLKEPIDKPRNEKNQGTKKKENETLREILDLAIKTKKT